MWSKQTEKRKEKRWRDETRGKEVERSVKKGELSIGKKEMKRRRRSVLIKNKY